MDPHEQLWVLDASGYPLYGSAPRVEFPRAWWRHIEVALDAAAGPVTLITDGVHLIACRLAATTNGGAESAAVAIRVRTATPSLPVPLGRAGGDVAITPRQLEVCEYAASGATVGEIASELRISAGTVRTHLKAVYRNLGVGNRVELARALGHLDARASS